jgi:16S rRNA (cytosine1402-N4)-methyltransferase
MVDCTFGGGNHSVPLLQKHPSLKILGVDLDQKTIDACKDKYASLLKERRLAILHSNYVNIGAIDAREAFGRKVGIKPKYDIALLDLGFSSY